MSKIFIIIVVLLVLIIALVTIPSCKDQTYIQGQRLYSIHCANCHMDDGSGLENVIPSIEASSFFDTKIDSLPCLIRHGRANYMTNDSIMLDMPVNYRLTEYEINNIVNHIMTTWYPERSIVPIQQTRKNLNDCPIPAMRFGQ